MKALCLCLVLWLPLSVAAQVQLGISSGAGWTYVASKNTDAQYGASFLPRIDCSLKVPLGKILCLNTGLGYQRKGYSVHSVLLDDQLQVRDIFSSVVRFDYIQVPLQLSYQYTVKKRQQLQFAAGLYYGFLLHAGISGQHEYFSDGGYVINAPYAFPLQVGLTRTSPNATGRRTDELLIDCGMKFQLNYLFHEHFSAGLFHERSLYDINAKNTGTTSLKMRCTGFSIGYIF